MTVALVVAVHIEPCAYCKKPIRKTELRNKRGTWVREEIHGCPARPVLAEYVDAVDEVFGDSGHV